MDLGVLNAERTITNSTRLRAELGNTTMGMVSIKQLMSANSSARPCTASLLYICGSRQLRGETSINARGYVR
jgi:hypothetical protein